ncbi:MFS transporter [Ammoniphilus sp. YIM 78166]|uniref:MFS transporter n=1 Tax=Ammoniphilus sp. YIM 78166 TaxID=1644106 RepID=UPI00106F5E8A|nr:MFS transporter [Ammoniphilus sp. YIM 78166]
MTQPILWNRDFIAACLSSFFLFMTFYTLAVTMPVYVLDELHSSQDMVGLVMAVFIMSTVVMRPLTGKWIDERDRKKILFVSLFLFLMASILYPVAKGIVFLLILRFIHGIGFGMGTTSLGAVVISFIPENRKGEGVGYFSLFMGLAMVIGPFVGLMVIQHYSFTVLFSLCIVFSLLSFVCGYLTRIPERDVEKTSEKENRTGWKSFIEPRAIPVALAGSLLAFSYGGITTFISVYAIELNINHMSGYFFMVFAAMIVLSRPFTGKMFDRMGENVLIYPGLFLFVVGMIGLSFASSPVLFLTAGAVIGLGYGALLPSYQTIAIKVSPNNRQGLATSTFFLFFDSGYGIGSYLLGIIASRTSYATMYLVSAFIAGFAALLYYLLHHRKLAAVQPKGL